MRKIGELIEGHPLIHAESSQKVRDVAKIMSKANIGAIAVLDSERLVGVFSERELPHEERWLGERTYSTQPKWPAPGFHRPSRWRSGGHLARRRRPQKNRRRPARR